MATPASSPLPPPEIANALTDASAAGIAVAVLSAYILFFGPGHAWWRGGASGVPRLLARIAVSTLWTTVLGLALAAADAFSLPRVAVVNGAVTLLGYTFVARVRREGEVSAAAAGLACATVFAAALWCYWPPYETDMAASDATSYTATGVHLARERHLWKYDPLVEKLAPVVRGPLFFSVMGWPWKPPYSRMPGGLVIETPHSPIVRPSFFPVPVVWSALFADALGAHRAGGFAPVFAALAVGAFWVVARRRLGIPSSLLATSLVALNAASYWAGRFPLSEPLAWFFLWSGLAALDAYEEDGFPADARLAGALLGAVGLVRVEYVAFVSAALLIRYLMRADLGCRPLTPGFIAWFVLALAAVAGEIELLPGSYAAPIYDAWMGLRYRAEIAWSTSPLILAGSVAVCLVLALAAVRKLGILRAVVAGAVAAFLLGYFLTSHSTIGRSLTWLLAYLGLPALVLAAAGAMWTWRERHVVSGDGFLVVLAMLVTAALVYAPHVYPAMPWASRRFVPIVVPALLLWAVAALSHIGRRAPWAVLPAAVVLAAGVLAPARSLWARPFYAGTHDTLQSLAARLPSDGTLLIDNRLISLLLSPPLWLAYDRNSLPVDTSTLPGRQNVSGVVVSLDDEGPLYLVKPSAAPVEPIPFVWETRVADLELELALPEQTSARPPRAIESYFERISVFRLHLWKPAAPAGTGPATGSAGQSR